MIDKWWAKDEWLTLIFMISYMAMKDWLPKMWAERILLIVLAFVMLYFVVKLTVYIINEFRHTEITHINYFINKETDYFIVWLIPVLFKLATFYLVYVVMMIEWGNLWNYIMVFGGIVLVLVMFDEYFERHSEVREVLNENK
ncbi:hypothetical protein ACFPVV_00235 [Macrococcoides bohemicum]|uniref:Uncharacterized protein n=1 Tax=Macrococcoides bohemicum TaxID=1903056 RepID=A0A328A7Y3_9STAP|nr:hypothetical protein [Macrococcus bohemicus]RAK49934.1 hypothetical protein BHX94_00225 [Macrococcus bohemicus]